MPDKCSTSSIPMVKKYLLVINDMQILILRNKIDSLETGDY